MSSDEIKNKADADMNRDPITDTPGAHPVGSGVGAAAGGAATGAAVGTFAGPIGTAVGIVAGGLIGGLAGKGVAEKIDPTAEHDYWRSEVKNRDYYKEGVSYDDHYGPAYQYGWERVDLDRHENKGQVRSFDEHEAVMRKDWDSHRQENDSRFDDVKPIVRDAFERAKRQQNK